jgi:hypothetical protein
MRNMIAALETVSDRIEATRGIGLDAPSPYPQIANLNLGLKCLRQGSYWFAFTSPPTWSSPAFSM